MTVASSDSVIIGYQEHRAKQLAQALESVAWQRLSCGHGSKGERLDDWARIEVNCSHEQGMNRWILFRRNLEKPDEPLSTSYYQRNFPGRRFVQESFAQVYAAAETSLEEMVFVVGARWRIEELF